MNTDMDKGAQVLKLLGDRTRLTMMKILESQDCCVCEFTAIFNLSQPAVSQHIRKLKDARLVTETRRGQWVFYSLNKDTEDYPLVRDILNHFPGQAGRLKELEQQGLRIFCD
ncbi:ArsR/SmtB family transcription factor [Mesobacillus zeae]|uniref:Transcriptional regulator n=1 Tax=Mesobacillus zeae TaxID=1917180 RepID=A0A398AY31_9BACI|nr:metalloregulator ArsR/SmtB family transcription factor [Mesobacillus zeae]RID82475.1 transcriptional regulator [Mesobacillus zeae]